MNESVFFHIIPAHQLHRCRWDVRDAVFCLRPLWTTQPPRLGFGHAQLVGLAADGIGLSHRHVDNVPDRRCTAQRCNRYLFTDVGSALHPPRIHLPLPFAWWKKENADPGHLHGGDL